MTVLEPILLLIDCVYDIRYSVIMGFCNHPCLNSICSKFSYKNLTVIIFVLKCYEMVCVRTGFYK